REDDRVEVDDGEIDQALRLSGAEMGEVVNDVFTGRQGMLFCGHRFSPDVFSSIRRVGVRRCGRARAARTSTTAGRAPSTPAAPARLATATAPDGSAETPPLRPG